MKYVLALIALSCLVFGIPWLQKNLNQWSQTQQELDALAKTINAAAGPTHTQPSITHQESDQNEKIIISELISGRCSQPHLLSSDFCQYAIEQASRQCAKQKNCISFDQWKSQRITAQP